jgi:hypothetical protein
MEEAQQGEDPGLKAGGSIGRDIQRRSEQFAVSAGPHAPICRSAHAVCGAGRPVSIAWRARRQAFREWIESGNRLGVDSCGREEQRNHKMDDSKHRHDVSARDLDLDLEILTGARRSKDTMQRSAPVPAEQDRREFVA